MTPLTDFETYLQATKGLLLKDTNKKFVSLPTADQIKWVNEYALGVQEKLSGYGAGGIDLDITHIAFAWRLLKKAHARKGPHKRLNGKPHGCYENCFAMVNANSAIYTGYARNRGELVLQSGKHVPAWIWIRHSWLVNSKKQIIETTPHDFSAYFGIHVDPELLWYLITTGVSPSESELWDAMDPSTSMRNLPSNFPKKEVFDFKMPKKR